MQLSFEHIESIADLSQKIKKAKGRIKELSSTMGQLTLDSCTTVVKVHVHNGSIHSKNEALHTAARLGNTEAADQVKPCTTHLSFCISEATTLRMLQVLLSEEEASLEELQLEAEARYLNTFTPTLVCHEA